MLAQLLGITSHGGASLPEGFFRGRLGPWMKVINGMLPRWRGSKAFLEAASLDAQSPSLSSPDAIFTGSTECLSVTRAVIERGK